MYRMVERSLVSQLRRGTLEYCVLALLQRAPHYGFDLVRALASIDGMETGEGTIYPLLSRLRREGLVRTTWRESTTGPPRRYYECTPAGERALELFVPEWERFAQAVNSLLQPPEMPSP
jgi:PadR family transcriptional regulator PadR